MAPVATRIYLEEEDFGVATISFMAALLTAVDSVADSAVSGEEEEAVLAEAAQPEAGNKLNQMVYGLPSDMQKKNLGGQLTW